MRCPYCRIDDDKVGDSRPADDGGAVRRRRECLACGQRFTTHERIDEVALLVRKRSGQREPFDAGKLAAGLERAVHGGAVDGAAVRWVALEIEEEARTA